MWSDFKQLCLKIRQNLGSDSMIFTAVHGMQTRSSDENSVRLSVCPSVRPSVCPSVWYTRALWQNGRKIYPDLYTVRKIIYPSFLRRRMVGGERPLLSKILDQLAPVLAKSPIFNRYSSLFCVFSPNLTDFQANYITVVEDGPLIGENYNAHCSAGFLR